MFEGQLPRQINVLQFARQGISLIGQLPLKDMTRLAAVLLENDGVVTVKLLFGVDEEGIRYVSGTLTAQLNLLCQRCLKPMTYYIDDNLMLGVSLSHAQALSLPKHYDPLLVTSEMQTLLSIIEDELIVRLPIAAMHIENECQLKTVATKIETDNVSNPFAELSKLK